MRLKELRENKKITQAELGKALSISTSTIGMYEQGRRNPDPDMLCKIADYFNITVDDLLGRKPKLTNPDASISNKIENRDIVKILDNLISDLNKKDIVFYNGDDELADEPRQLILQSLKVSAEIAKQGTKEKSSHKKKKKNKNK